jgi:hypothetical protein
VRGNNSNVTIRDQRALQTGLDQNSRQIKENAEGDIIVEMPRRLFLRDTDGIYWQITVSTTGVLTVTSVGATLP